MTSTADRYREAGMPPPRDEVYLPLGPHRRSEAILREAVAVTDVRRAARKTRALPLATPDLADSATPPETPAATYGPDSVPLDPPDANTTEETS